MGLREVVSGLFQDTRGGRSYQAVRLTQDDPAPPQETRPERVGGHSSVCRVSPDGKELDPQHRGVSVVRENGMDPGGSVESLGQLVRGMVDREMRRKKWEIQREVYITSSV